ncbi:type II secretion system protein [Candidatus Kaiserbacteria bacterium]|nr:MAG: type II secretion system protein [Candidatus Kaiserbacteria bacterium]
MREILQRGFTYIELLMVVGLTGIILSFGIVMNMDSIARASVLQERDLFVSLLLSGARAKALANAGNVSYGVHVDTTNHRYVLFEGEIFIEGTASNRITPFTSEHITITHSAAHENIIFERLSGSVSEGAGILTISGNGKEQQITINDVGQIDW